MEVDLKAERRRSGWQAGNIRRRLIYVDVSGLLTVEQNIAEASNSQGVVTALVRLERSICAFVSSMATIDHYRTATEHLIRSLDNEAAPRRAANFETAHAEGLAHFLEKVTSAK